MRKAKQQLTQLCKSLKVERERQKNTLITRTAADLTAEIVCWKWNFFNVKSKAFHFVCCTQENPDFDVLKIHSKLDLRK